MLRALYTGVTGVKEHQKWIDNTANNVANVNSDGFKKTRTTFADLISQRYGFALPAEAQRGGVNPKQVGIGVGNATMEVIHAPGSIKATDKETDLAINGDGFFIVNGGKDDLYTRNGNFGFDAEGSLVYSPNGYRVQGWNNTEDAQGPITAVGGSLEDIKIDLNDIMPPKETITVTFDGELNKGHAQAIEDATLENGQMVKFKKVLGSEDAYEYYLADENGRIIKSALSSSSAVDLSLNDAYGTITVNDQLFYLSNYLTLNDLMEDVEAQAGVDMNYENGILSVSALSVSDDLSLVETGDSLLGAKINTQIDLGTAGLIQDDFNGYGKIHQGSAIGTIKGRIVGATINGTSEGIMVGVAGASAPGRTATVTGEIIGNLQGSFDGEGMAGGAVKIYEGYLKGDVGALSGVTDIATPTPNAWIDGTVNGNSIGFVNGTMKGYVDSTRAPSALTNTFNGDFELNGHVVGFAKVNTQKGIYGSIVGDAGIGALTSIATTLAPVTINGPGKIQGSVGGRFTSAANIVGAESINSMINNNRGINSLTARATLDNAVTQGAVLGTLTGIATGELYQWDPADGGNWSHKGQVHEMNVDNIYGAVIGKFSGDVDGLAQGDIIMDDTTSIVGVVTGITGENVDHDNNGVADAYIDITKEGKLVGGFAGQTDTYGQIFAAKDAGDWVRADFEGEGWLEGSLIGELKGTVNGEAHGEINGLIKHAAVSAMHFIGHGATMSEAITNTPSHLNIKFKGEAVGRVGTAVDMAGTITDLVEGLASSAAYINGKAEGFLSIMATNQFLLGKVVGKTTLTADSSIATIEGEIKGEVSSRKAELEGDIDGYFTGRGEVEGKFEGVMSGPGSFEGEMTGEVVNAHMVGWAEGFVENAGPVSGQIDLDNVTFRGTFKGAMKLEREEVITGSFDGKLDGIYRGQIDAEKKLLPGLFTVAKLFGEETEGTLIEGMKEQKEVTIKSTGGKMTMADGGSANFEIEIDGEQFKVNASANQDYKIKTKVTAFDSLGQTRDVQIELENTGDSVWLFTASDGTAGKIFFDPSTGKMTDIEYENKGQYDFDLSHLVQFVGPNDINLIQDGYGKGHLKDITIKDDGRIVGFYDNEQIRDLAQVAVATFNNPGGLEKVGTTMFKQTANSREPKIEVAGTAKSGSIATKTLEMSNVNLTEEFANMIVAQQAFVANIRTVTTGDRLLTELMRLRP